MVLVAIVAAVFWWCFSRSQLRWFWVGVGLWTISVVLKIACALVTNPLVLPPLEDLPFPLHVTLGALYSGVHSSLFEMGFTLLAVLIWHQLGRNAGRAIAIGVGAGAFEAFLLGLVAFASGFALIFVEGKAGEEALKGLEHAASITPLYWLAGPVERIIAILCHASSRALILLGVAKKRYMLIFWGFLIFTLLDGVAGGAHVGGFVGKISAWWVELAILPCGLVSIPILIWCYRRWGKENQEEESVDSEPQPPLKKDDLSPLE